MTLEADGSGTEVADMSFVHERTLVKRGFDFHAAEGPVIHFADRQGNELPAETTQQNGRVRYDVRLPRPLMPGRRFGYIRTQECPQAATEEDGVWTYATDYSYGYDTNEFSHTVVLPKGAEIVEVNPWPVATFRLNDKPTVRFEGTRGRTEPFKYRVKYRLPNGG